MSKLYGYFRKGFYQMNSLGYLFSNTAKQEVKKDGKLFTKSIAKYSKNLGYYAIIAGGVSYYYLNKREDVISAVKAEIPEVRAEIPEVRAEIPEVRAEIPEVKVGELIPVPIPEYVPFITIGGGTTAYAAAKSIRISDPRARILMITKDNYLPYKKTFMSKILLNIKLEPESLNQLEEEIESQEHVNEQYYVTPLEVMTKANGGIGILNNTAVIEIDPTLKKVILEDGREIFYDKCLIATGSSPKLPKPFENIENNLKEKVIAYHSYADYVKLINMLVKNDVKTITIVGGGSLGCEIASSMARYHEEIKINHVFTKNSLMEDFLPEYLSEYITQKIKEMDVKLYNNDEIQCVKEGSNNSMELQLKSGELLQTDIVLLTDGFKPNTELAEKAGLEIDRKNGGIMVNSELAVNSSLWCAGDVASFYDPRTQLRRQLESTDNSFSTGELAGNNMMGKKKMYSAFPMNWYTIGELFVQTIGHIDPSLQTSGVFMDPSGKATWQPPQPDDQYKKGIVYYLKDDVIVGIVLWNIVGLHFLANRVLKMSPHSKDITEISKLFTDIENDMEKHKNESSDKKEDES